MERTKEMQETLDMITKKFLGHSHTEARKNNFCLICKSPKMNLGDFKDDLSRREAAISQMCQECQDKTFVEEE